MKYSTINNVIRGSPVLPRATLVVRPQRTSQAVYEKLHGHYRTADLEMMDGLEMSQTTDTLGRALWWPCGALL